MNKPWTLCKKSLYFFSSYLTQEDLSRLGRHKTQTALFIDYLREKRVRVLSATEGIDTFREEDDLLLGVRGLMNDYYARDIGKKIRAGYRQKQKVGLVITPPFGFRKDRNTNEILIYPEAAVTVQMIFSLYLQGCGQKEIARRLNAMGRKTPAQLRAEVCGRDFQKAHKTRDGRYLWTYASVKNVLVEEAYTGVLNNHRSETVEGKVKRLNAADWLRHENYYPVIIEREEWKQVQRLLKQNARPVTPREPVHRYAGLLRCADCGNPFISMNRYWNGNRRVEYVCKGYHRSGKDYCASHRIHEETIDAAVWKCLTAVHTKCVDEQVEWKKTQKMWALRKPVLDAHIRALQEKIQRLEGEIDAIVMEKIVTSHY